MYQKVFGKEGKKNRVIIRWNLISNKRMRCNLFKEMFDICLNSLIMVEKCLFKAINLVFLELNSSCCLLKSCISSFLKIFFYAVIYDPLIFSYPDFGSNDNDSFSCDSLVSLYLINPS